MPSKEEIEAAMTPKHGYTKEQLARWGIKWPPRKGWKDKLIQLHEAEPPCWKPFV